MARKRRRHRDINKTVFLDRLKRYWPHVYANWLAGKFSEKGKGNMSDLVERLRLVPLQLPARVDRELLREAADEIEQLRNVLRVHLGQDKTREGDIEQAWERTPYYQEMSDEIERLRLNCLSKDDEIGQLREAAEIFRDFGQFSHLYCEYDLEQVSKARKTLE